MVDFLDFPWGRIHWPAISLANVFIVCPPLSWCLLSHKAPACAVASGCYEASVR